MTYEEAREELCSCKYIQYAIRQCKDSIARLNNELNFTGSIIKRPEANNPLVSKADQIRYKLEIETDRYDNLITELVDLQRTLEKRIELVGLDNKLCSQVLRMRYLAGMRYDSIGKELNYSCEWVRHCLYEGIRIYSELNARKINTT